MAGEVGTLRVSVAWRNWINVRDPLYFLGYGIPYIYENRIFFSSWRKCGLAKSLRRFWVWGLGCWGLAWFGMCLAWGVWVQGLVGFFSSFGRVLGVEFPV